MSACPETADGRGHVRGTGPVISDRRELNGQLTEKQHQVFDRLPAWEDEALVEDPVRLRRAILSWGPGQERRRVLADISRSHKGVLLLCRTGESGSMWTP